MRVAQFTRRCSEALLIRKSHPDPKVEDLQIILVMLARPVEISPPGKLQRPSIGSADGGLWGLVRTVARKVEESYQ